MRLYFDIKNTNQQQKLVNIISFKTQVSKFRQFQEVLR